MSDDLPLGALFSHVYDRRGEPERDSRRARRRLAAHFFDIGDGAYDFTGELERRLGVDISYGYEGAHWQSFFEDVSLKDLLNSITVIHDVYRAAGDHPSAARWRKAVQTIFEEENLSYCVDERCGVRYRVDQEFAYARAATLAGLGLDRYQSVRASFEAAYEALDGAQPDTRGAIRHVFDSLETLFRLMIGDKACRLGGSEVSRLLTPHLNERYGGTDRLAVSKQVQSFCDWIDSAHFYRHAQGVEQPSPPPVELAVLAISSGAAYLRWLIELDRWMAAKSTEAVPGAA